MPKNIVSDELEEDKLTSVIVRTPEDRARGSGGELMLVSEEVLEAIRLEHERKGKE